MNETFVTAKAAIAAFFTAVAAFLDWQGIMALSWAFLMLLDYLSGSWAARKDGTWKSSIARDGLLHKGGMILVVIVAWVADLVLTIALPHIPVLGISWPNVLFPLVLAWYIITELGSILENAVKLGASVPSWLVQIFNASVKAVDKVASELVDLDKTEEEKTE